MAVYFVDSSALVKRYISERVSTWVLGLFDSALDKAARNLSKHGVSFEEAKTVFDDPLYIDFYEPDHSEHEARYLIVGVSNRRRLLIVSYTERGDSIHLISAREVTQSEREAYEEG
jgi:uncharacterized protein